IRGVGADAGRERGGFAIDLARARPDCTCSRAHPSERVVELRAHFLSGICNSGGPSGPDAPRTSELRTRATYSCAFSISVLSVSIVVCIELRACTLNESIASMV